MDTLDDVVDSIDFSSKPAESKQPAGLLSFLSKAYKSLKEPVENADKNLIEGLMESPVRQSSSLKWESLDPKEKRIAISLAAMAMPAGAVPAVLSRFGGPGILSAVLRALGWGAEGAALGGGVQAAGNLTTGEPVMQGVADAAKYGAAINAGLGIFGTQAPVVSEEAKRLMGKGVTPTVGQAVAEGNIAGRAIARTEEALASTPLIGDVVRNARGRAESEVRNITLDRARAPEESALVGTTQDRLAQLQQQFNERYGAAARSADFDVQAPAFRKWMSDTVKHITDPTKGIRPEEQGRLYNYIQARLRAGAKADPSGKMIIPGETMRGIESDLGKMQRSFSRASSSGSSDAFESGQKAVALGQTIQDLRSARSRLSPEAAAIYQETNPLYREYVPMRDASIAALNNGGNFTPNQVIAQIKKRGGKSRLASGGGAGSLQKWEQDAAEVLRNGLPNSGTADRTLPWLMLGSLGVGAGGEAYSNTGMPGSEYAGYLWAVPALALGSSRAGQGTILNLMRAGELAGPTVRRLGTVGGSGALTGYEDDQ